MIRFIIIADLLLISVVASFFISAVYCLISAYRQVYIPRLPVRHPHDCDEQIAVSYDGDGMVCSFPRLIDGSDKSSAIVAVSMQDVSFPARDDLKIAAWFLPAPTDCAVIILHGHRTNRSQCTPQIRHLAGHFNLLVPDLRAHGGSEGDKVSFCGGELEDIGGAIDWLKKQGISKVALLGLSMGGVASIVYASRNQDVSAVITEGAFADLRDQVHHKASQRGIFVPLLAGPVNGLIHMLAGLDEPCSPKDAAPNISCPTLVLQSSADKSIPADSGVTIASANPEKIRYVMMPPAEHVHLATEQPQAFREVVMAFLDEHLGCEQRQV